MNIDSKTLEQQDMKMLVHSLELVSARIFESMITLNQVSCSNTPEMNSLFNQWVSCLGQEVIRAVGEKGELDPEEISKSIGVSSSTIISLALALHRQGKIRIKSFMVEPGDNVNTEICDCFK
ncbi:MAG: hypothetical protein GX672_09620 [Synergistaceae bacterium]|nr:hypothetical protein [Synergistaceae bacterium]